MDVMYWRQDSNSTVQQSLMQGLVTTTCELQKVLQFWEFVLSLIKNLSNFLVCFVERIFANFRSFVLFSSNSEWCHKKLANAIFLPLSQFLVNSLSYYSYCQSNNRKSYCSIIQSNSKIIAHPIIQLAIRAVKD